MEFLQNLINSNFFLIVTRQFNCKDRNTKFRLYLPCFPCLIFCHHSNTNLNIIVSGYNEKDNGFKERRKFLISHWIAKDGSCHWCRTSMPILGQCQRTCNFRSTVWQNDTEPESGGSSGQVSQKRALASPLKVKNKNKNPTVIPLPLLFTTSAPARIMHMPVGCHSSKCLKLRFWKKQSGKQG